MIFFLLKRIPILAQRDNMADDDEWQEVHAKDGH